MISGKTAVYGIFGYPVEHTFSPSMQNAAFRKAGINACYLPFPVHPGQLADAARSVIALSIHGVNVTVPHKEKIIPFLDSLSEEARLVGAVNTIEVHEGRLTGHNTDGRGFLRSLKEEGHFNPAGKRFLCAGAGGAARAVCFSLALAGASRIDIFNVRSERADILSADIRGKTGADVRSIRQESLEESAREADCLINATPLGLKIGDPLPIPSEGVVPRHLVCDLVYNPVETNFLAEARKKKAKTLSGMGMLLFQGVIAFEIWTGKQAPIATMRSALNRQIRGQNRKS